jgi:hypothetical protein
MVTNADPYRRKTQPVNDQPRHPSRRLTWICTIPPTTTTNPITNSPDSTTAPRGTTQQVHNNTQPPPKRDKPTPKHHNKHPNTNNQITASQHHRQRPATEAADAVVSIALVNPITAPHTIKVYALYPFREIPSIRGWVWGFIN